MTKRRYHIVNQYQYLEDNRLSIMKFDEMSEEWLQFVVDCRRGIKHDYDIVEGPMADDTIWDYVEDYVANRISKKDDDICETIDNYNCSAYYEPSYVIARAYNDGGF